MSLARRLEGSRSDSVSFHKEGIREDQALSGLLKKGFGIADHIGEHRTSCYCFLISR